MTALDGKKIGERISTVRGQESLADFAAKVDASAPTLMRYEKGEIPEAIDTFVKIAKTGRKTLDWLIIGEQAGSIDKKDSRLNSLEAKLAQARASPFFDKMIDLMERIYRLLSTEDPRIERSLAEQTKLIEDLIRRKTRKKAV